jgi:hypothetical protein
MKRRSVVRAFSQAGVDLAERHGGRGEPTNGWQDKSAASGAALMVGRSKQFCDLSALPCRRFQSIHQRFQCADRHRHTDAAENALGRAQRRHPYQAWPCSRSR